MGNMRMDMRLDAIEDAIADVGWKVAQLCLRFMDAQTVQQLIGIDVSQFWHPLNSLHDFAKLSVTVVGGSTQKVSSQAKKQEAVQVGQILSQYVKAAPATTLKVTLRMFSNAFDNMNITKEDWAGIDAEIEKTLLAGQGGAPGMQPGGGQPGQPPAPPPGQPGIPPGGPGGGPNPMQMASLVTNVLEQLPPQVLRAIGVALAQGAPPQAILQQMMQAVGGGGQGAPPPQGPQAPVMRPPGMIQ